MVNFGGSWLSEFERIAVEKGWNINKEAMFEGPDARKAQREINLAALNFEGYDPSMASLKIVEDGKFGSKSMGALNRLRIEVAKPEFAKLYAGEQYHEMRSNLDSPDPKMWLSGLMSLNAMFLRHGSPAQLYVAWYKKMHEGVGDVIPGQKPVKPVVKPFVKDTMPPLHEVGVGGEVGEKIFEPKHSAQIIHSLISLANDLDKMGAEEAAIVVDHYIKEASDKLYGVTGETGEDLVNIAHPGGGPVVAPAANEGGKVETIVEEQKKVVEKALKSPTGKVAEAADKPPKKYRDTGATSKSDYADPDNFKYPIHTEKNTRAALSYFSKSKNYEVYSPAERSKIWSRIKSAAKRYKIELDPDNDPPWGKKSKAYVDAIQKLIKKANALEEAGQVEAAQLVDKAIRDLQVAVLPFVSRSAANEAAGSEDIKASVKLAAGPLSLYGPEATTSVGKGVAKGLGKVMRTPIGNIARIPASALGKAVAGKAALSAQITGTTALGTILSAVAGGLAIGAIGAKAIGMLNARLTSQSEIDEDLKDLLLYVSNLQARDESMTTLTHKIEETLTPFLGVFVESNNKDPKLFQKYQLLSKAYESVGEDIDRLGELAEKSRHWYNVVGIDSWTPLDVKLKNYYKDLGKSISDVANTMKELASKLPKAQTKTPQAYADRARLHTEYRSLLMKIINAVGKYGEKKFGAEKVAAIISALQKELDESAGKAASAEDLQAGVKALKEFLIPKLTEEGLRFAKTSPKTIPLFKNAGPAELAETLKSVMGPLKNVKKTTPARKTQRRVDPNIGALQQNIRALQQAMINAGIEIKTGDGRDPVSGEWNQSTWNAYNELLERVHSIDPQIQLPMAGPTTPPKDFLEPLRIARFIASRHAATVSGEIEIAEGKTIPGTALRSVGQFVVALVGKNIINSNSKDKNQRRNELYAQAFQVIENLYDRFRTDDIFQDRLKINKDFNLISQQIQALHSFLKKFKLLENQQQVQTSKQPDDLKEPSWEVEKVAPSNSKLNFNPNDLGSILSTIANLRMMDVVSYRSFRDNVLSDYGADVKAGYKNYYQQLITLMKALKAHQRIISQNYTPEEFRKYYNKLDMYMESLNTNVGSSFRS